MTDPLRPYIGSHSSTSVSAAEDLARADHATRPRDKKTFRSVRDALGWYFETRERMQSPNGMHPRGEKTATGEVVVLDVDGGQGSSLEDILCTLSTIGTMLEQLKREQGMERAFPAVCLWGMGTPYSTIAEKLGVSTSTASAEVGKGFSYLLGLMRAGGVLG